MKEKLLHLFPVKSGEWGLVLSLSTILAINTLVLELSDAVATSGFVSDAGPTQLPWLWAVDMLIALLFAGAYSMFVDRVPRIQLVSWLFGGLALLYLIILALFSYGAPDWLNYFLLYILSDQQWMIFPLAFWALANDVYTMSQSKRLFPMIGAGYAIGSIVGNGLAAGSAMIFAQRDQSASQLLIVGAVAFLIGLGVIQLAFHNRKIRARQSKETDTSLRDTIQLGLDFVKDVPLFRYLALAILMGGLALTLIEFHFIYSIDQSFSDPLKFQTFYGLYKTAQIVATLFLQWLVIGRLLKRTPAKNTFIILPITLLIASAGSLLATGLVGSAAGRFLSRVTLQVWDEPARKSVQNLVPDERRGRISAFLDSYLFALATLAGCLLLGLLILGLNQNWISQQAMITVYLACAGVTAAVGLWAAIKLRTVYEPSMLNWRLARSRRKSVLDGIEF